MHESELIMQDFQFRKLQDSDSLEALTEMLHLAYADHARAGRMFFASHQTVDDTRRRISKGECWLALQDNKITGTVTLSPAYRFPDGYPAAPNAGMLQQLAILPNLRGHGLGNALLELAENRLRELHSPAAALDTSSLATDLIRWYERRGYSRTGTWKWNVTNYESVVLGKVLS